MAESMLAQAVERFARVTQGLSEPELERPWAWQSYDSEGVRFAFFRTYEELRDLAAATAAERVGRGPAPTEAQGILAQYHAAYRDLQALLIGADDQMDRAPAEGEWPLRAVLEHIVGADVGFFVVIRYALDRHQTGDGRPAKVPEEAWEAIIGAPETHFEAAMRGPLAEVWAYYEALHERVLGEFAGLGATELALPSSYWEDEPMSVRFRLHRFDSHLRQHTVQVEKTLEAIGRGPSEAKRLLRLIYAALAEAEGAALGAGERIAERWRETATAITARADEIAGLIVR